MRPAPPLLLLSACLTACAPLRDTTLRVEDGSGRPSPGALVSAVALRAGTVPLPLNSATLAELLAEDKTAQTSAADARGRATLRLRGDVPHLIQAKAWPGAVDPGAEPAWSVYSLDADATALERLGSGGSGGITVIVVR